MRVFIAIEFDDEIKDYLDKKREEIMKNSLKGNFTIKDNFHLTLRFIGEVDKEQIIKIKNTMDETFKETKIFTISLGKLGRFVRQNKNIVWIGVDKGLKDLKVIFERLELNLERKGFKRNEMGLIPHITIGREVVLNKGFDILKDEITIDNKFVTVKRIFLMESCRINGALKYIPIYAVDFK